MICYLIHYTRNQERLARMRPLLKSLELDYLIVTAWDSDDIPNYSSLSDVRLWSQHCLRIKNILIANASRADNESYSTSLSRASNCYSQPSWLNPRQLNAGEISVLLKHFFALSCIANGQNDIGIVMEDDLFLHTTSRSMLAANLIQFRDLQGDYLDILAERLLNLTLMTPLTHDF